MGTVERRETPGSGGTAHATAPRNSGAADRDIPTTGQRARDGHERRAGTGDGTAHEAEPRAGEYGGPQGRQREQAAYRPLWTEEPARRRRLPDPVRTAAVRAVLLIAVTLIQAMVAFLCTMAGSWSAFPMVISSVASTVVATWGVLDVWVTRQVYNQRHGVVSAPSSTARALRRERRRARRQARTAERARNRIRRRGGTGQLSHP
ncbi:hypothetical protein GCM10010129_66930 [Streptomyces fumigatiscleroticus]|nr:hypothetical protein GCM10010129_66930 [Streptomyces fumigatiscleroticus]